MNVLQPGYANWFQFKYQTKSIIVLFIIGPISKKTTCIHCTCSSNLAESNYLVLHIIVANPQEHTTVISGVLKDIRHHNFFFVVVILQSILPSCVCCLFSNMKNIIFLVGIITMCVIHTEAFANGAPAIACSDFIPQHLPNQAATGPIPYIVDVSSIGDSYTSGQTYPSKRWTTSS